MKRQKYKMIGKGILNDPRWGMLDDQLWRMALEFMLVCDHRGRLPSIHQLAFLLRASEEDLLNVISQLEKVPLITRCEDGLFIDTRHLGNYKMLRDEWLLLRREMTVIVFKRDGRVCRNCGSVEDLTIDHIIPLIAGGTSEPENLQVLCRPCNSRKGPRYDG